MISTLLLLSALGGQPVTAQVPKAIPYRFQDGTPGIAIHVNFAPTSFPEYPHTDMVVGVARADVRIDRGLNRYWRVVAQIVDNHHDPRFSQTDRLSEPDSMGWFDTRILNPRRGTVYRMRFLLRPRVARFLRDDPNRDDAIRYLNTQHEGFFLWEAKPSLEQWQQDNRAAKRDLIPAINPPLPPINPRTGQPISPLKDWLKKEGYKPSAQEVAGQVLAELDQMKNEDVLKTYADDEPEAKPEPKLEISSGTASGICGFVFAMLVLSFFAGANWAAARYRKEIDKIVKEHEQHRRRLFER